MKCRWRQREMHNSTLTNRINTPLSPTYLSHKQQLHSHIHCAKILVTLNTTSYAILFKTGQVTSFPFCQTMCQEFGSLLKISHWPWLMPQRILYHHYILCRLNNFFNHCISQQCTCFTPHLTVTHNKLHSHLPVTKLLTLPLTLFSLIVHQRLLDILPYQCAKSVAVRWIFHPSLFLYFSSIYFPMPCV